MFPVCLLATRSSDALPRRRSVMPGMGADSERPARLEQFADVLAAEARIPIVNEQTRRDASKQLLQPLRCEVDLARLRETTGPSPASTAMTNGVSRSAASNFSRWPFESVPNACRIRRCRPRSPHRSTSTSSCRYFGRTFRTTSSTGSGSRQPERPEELAARLAWHRPRCARSGTRCRSRPAGTPGAGRPRRATDVGAVLQPDQRQVVEAPPQCRPVR